MTRPVILLDVDGVICDFINPCLAIINELTGKQHVVTAHTGWNIFEALGVPAQIVSATYDIMKQPGWCLGLPVLEGAIEGVRLLREHCDIHPCTSPMDGPTWVHERTAWLWDLFKFPSRDVIHTQAKHRCVGNALIDDKTDAVETWSRHHPTAVGIRWNTTANAGTPYAGVKTCDWTEVLNLVGDVR